MIFSCQRDRARLSTKYCYLNELSIRTDSYLGYERAAGSTVVVVPNMLDDSSTIYVGTEEKWDEVDIVVNFIVSAYSPHYPNRTNDERYSSKQV